MVIAFVKTHRQKVLIWFPMLSMAERILISRLMVPVSPSNCLFETSFYLRPDRKKGSTVLTLNRRYKMTICQSEVPL